MSRNACRNGGFIVSIMRLPSQVEHMPDAARVRRCRALFTLGGFELEWVEVDRVLSLAATQWMIKMQKEDFM